MNKISYPINLTEEQYKVIENILEPQKPERKHSFIAMVYFSFIMLMLNKIKF